VTLLALVGVGLMLPRVLGLAVYASERRLGLMATVRLMVAVAAETVLSTLIAPVQILHQSRAVAAALSGHDGGWKSHQTEQVPLRHLARFHGAETLIGLTLAALIATGQVTLWLAPVALGLTLALPLSWGVQRQVRYLNLFNLPRDA
jgi:membrane glycosyltransferase